MTQPTWQAYPEWGQMIKINIISMYVCIILLLIFLLTTFLIKKNNKKKTIINILKTMAYLFFVSTVVSKVIVVLNIYEHDLLYYIPFVIILSTIVFFISNKLKERQWPIIIVMCVVMVICFLTQDTYPQYTISNDLVYEGDLLLSKVKKQNLITQKDKEQATAYIEYSNTLGIDASSYIIYYIYKNDDDTYKYLKAKGEITDAGLQEEIIIKRGNINNRQELENIIKNLEKEMNSNSDGHKSIVINYKNNRIEKEELLNQLFE